MTKRASTSNVYSLRKRSKTAVITDPKLVAMAAAQLTGNEKREVLAATSVPLPDLNYATSMPCSSHTQHYEEKGFARNVQRSAKYWSRFAPTFRIPDVKLNQLAARPKPCLADKSRAQRVMRSMKNWEADCFSAKFCDADGQLLAAYFSNRVVTQDAPLSPKLAAKAAEHAPEYVGRKRTPSSLGRSLADFEHARQEPQSAPKVVFDGIKSELIEDALWATQVLHHFLHPHKSKTDGRHNFDDFLNKYPRRGSQEAVDILKSYEGTRLRFTHNGLEYQYEDESEASERTGVSHLVHAWQMRGHQGKDVTESPLRPSSDMIRNAQVALAVNWYMGRTRKLAMALGAMYQAAFPEDHKVYQKAFDAGVWLETDPGPWLGRAIVWKLNVLPHRDGQDAGPAAIFCMGNFSGGECYLTDLKVKLSYRPGDVLIFRACDLYHAIGDWTSEGGVTDKGITPGRVGNVFFTPAHSLQALHDKEPGWLKRCAGGALPPY